MASADRLESPYVIGGQTIQDGDYITLSIRDTSSDGLSGSFGSAAYNVTNSNSTYNVVVSSSSNYAGQGAQNRSVTLNAKIDKVLYVNNGPYSMNVSSYPTPVIFYEDNYVTTAAANWGGTYGTFNHDYNSPPRSNTSQYSTPLGTSDASASPITSAAMRAQNWYVSAYPSNGQPKDPSLPLFAADAIAPIPDKNNGTTSVTAQTSSPPLLCVELHDDDYMALRTPAGQYLHLLTAGSSPNSTFPSPRNQVPQSLVLSYSSLPSSQYTAQWSVYLMNGASSQIVLVNRATETCLTLDSTRQIGVNSLFYQCDANNSPFVYDYVYRSGALYYNAYYTMFAQWWDTYIQQYYRLTGSSTIDQINNRSVFTITKLTLPCNIGLNPLSPTCAKDAISGGDAVAAILNICQSGDAFSTPACRSWAIANPDQANDAVLTYFKNYPNDTTFGGCQNIWAFRELIDYLSLTTPPTTLYAKCNLKQCQPDIAWKSTAQIKNTCVQQICAQGINFNGTVSNTTIDKISQNCNFNNGTPTSSDPTTGTEMTSPFQPLLEKLEEIYEETLTRFGWTQFVIAFMVFAVVLCVILLVLPMIALNTSITLSLAVAIASLFVI